MNMCSKACLDWCKSHADVAPLVLRIALGSLFFMHGWQKLTMIGLPGVTGFLGSLGFPAPALFAVILMAIEILGGLAIILGLWTHLAAKLGALVALAAFFLVHIKNGYFVTNNGIEFIVLIFAASFSLMMTGAGKYSLDAKMGMGRPKEPLQGGMM